MDSLHKQLHSDRVGSDKNSVQPFTKKDGNILWERGTRYSVSGFPVASCIFL